ncbi:UDP-N-acetylmuramoyl-tripeptide--D-alanyl-D-alanine ligase [Spirochaeta lutea]|uniref:UDP-N-acetylmuramoyl-tripeptide--D-alanyl-D- alanine ligase n=1 Tax=Spirochaeta lutea TaxID=1480694 RepID=UPI00068F86C6|nr:UDP-N-acetylmuramoyl-tripeptide--D-alanyl-D-alanine ligase [Spirochaeta lutea]
MTEKPSGAAVLFTFPELTAHLGGFLCSSRRWAITGEDPHSEKIGITGFSIDSRSIHPGDLFIPLVGSRTDGHAYLEAAATAGCRAALVSRDFYRNNTNVIRSLLEQFPMVVYLVRDVLGGLHTLARHLLNQKKLFRIGITGSNGKTTAKELLASVLAQHAPTFMTPGNYNSVIGLPLAIPDITDEHEYGVFEMAMSEKGEMQRLSDLVFPDAALITSIGTAHIGNIGSQMGIAKEKFEIFRNCGPDTIAVLPENDEYTQRLKHKVRGKVFTFGPGTTPGYQGYVDQGVDGQIIRWKSRDIHLSVPGIHNLYNALGVITLAQVMGIPDDHIVEGLEQYRPVFGRNQVVRGPATILVDCYNANPDSMRASLESFKSLWTKGQKVAVLGDMKELGRFSREAHRDLAHQVLESGVSSIILYGPEIRVTYEMLQQQRGLLRQVLWTEDRDELVRLVQDTVNAGDLVLLKASRSMALEHLAEVITNSLEVGNV